MPQKALSIFSDLAHVPRGIEIFSHFEYFPRWNPASINLVIAQFHKLILKLKLGKNISYVKF